MRALTGFAALIVAGACLVPAAALAAGSGQVHHLATDKNQVSAKRGGPWTPRFEALFKRAGMKLDTEANKVVVLDHHGPHSEAYHQEVLDRLTAALVGAKTTAQCRTALTAELSSMKREINRRGSKLYRLLHQT
jgi:hypothetical protein